MPTVAIAGPGNMGAAIARLLVDRGVEVWTTLAGRSEASRARAAAAGMRDVPLQQLVEAQFVLSILPPAQALSFAAEVAQVVLATRHKPIFADCNAVNPDTVRKIGAVITAADTPFVDACIIGLPPMGGAPCPHIYVSGPAADQLRQLAACGLDVRVLDGPSGAASALKMSYAGINKGITTVITAMILAAQRAGAAEALRQEFADSDPQFLKSIDTRIPNMFPKAYRWVAEMQEIAEFAGDDAATRKMYQGAADLYERLANDFAGGQQEIGALSGFVKAR